MSTNAETDPPPNRLNCPPPPPNRLNLPSPSNEQTPIPLEVFGEFYPLPGAEEANPLRYSQVTGTNGTESADGSKVFAITGGSYICMLAESNG